MKEKKRNGNGHATGELDKVLMQAVADEADSNRQFRAQMTRLDELGKDAAPEDRLAAYRLAKKASAVPPDAGFYLIASVVDDVAWRRSREDQVLRRLSSVADSLAESAPEHEELDTEWEQVTDWIQVWAFLEFGETEHAILFVRDRAEFDKRYEAGRYHFFGPLPAAIESLAREKD